MESYLIRIYRIEKDDPESMVGIAKRIENGKTDHFKTLNELGRFLRKPDEKKHEKNVIEDEYLE